jgi:hypothetical protein
MFRTSYKDGIILASYTLGPQSRCQFYYCADHELIVLCPELRHFILNSSLVLPFDSK